jgi:hypothetical protein
MTLNFWAGKIFALFGEHVFDDAGEFYNKFY